ncbi:thioesterase family protein [Mycolicibacterium hodleri]
MVGGDGPADAGRRRPFESPGDGQRRRRLEPPHRGSPKHLAEERFRNRAVDVVEGASNSPLVNAVYAAEGTSLVTNLGTAGIGYINGDLTVALARLPVDEWIYLQADSHWTADGISTGSATLYDRVGAFGTGVVTAVSNPAAQIDFSADATFVAEIM